MKEKKIVDQSSEPKPQNEVVTSTPCERNSVSRSYGGSKYKPVNLQIIRQAIGSAWFEGLSPDLRREREDCVILTLKEIDPQDPMERMLAAQMIACHNAAMECFHVASAPGQTAEMVNDCFNQGNKLVRSYATLLSALDKHRGKGQQKITVERVYVHEGGQAIVGNVEHSGGGGNKKHEG